MIKTAPTLWTATDARRATGGTTQHDWAATGVSINTRTLKPGDLFIALEGPNVDGHDYVADAFEKGAAAACVAHRPPVLDPDAPLLVVEDTMKALEDLGAFARERTQAKVVAVTGSVGKTGTKDALNIVLSAQGKTTASEGSLNNHWGLPLSLARTPGDAAFAVLEMGMNHPGELTPLSLMARPHVCVITTIAPAHTEFFENTDEIADAKAEIFKGAERGGVAVLNADIEEFDRLFDAARARGLDIITFGERVDADVRVIAYELGAVSSTVTAMTPVGRVDYVISAPGKHWVLNSLAVLAGVHAAGGDVDRAAAAMTDVTPPQGRGARFEIDHKDGGVFTLIDESYNASPAAMRASLAVLANQPVGPGGRRIAVLGDMLELGEDTPDLHAGLKDALVEAGVDIVFLAGEAMNDLWKVLPSSMRGHHSVTAELLVDVVKKAIRPGDVVMIKGSAGARMGQVADKLKTLGRKHGGQGGDG